MNGHIYYTTVVSPIGQLLLAGDARGLHLIRLVEADAAAEMAKQFPGLVITQLDGFFDGAKAALEAYFKGQGPLALPCYIGNGTPLQRAVWLAMSKIPYGETITYTTLAERVGFPRAVRAVASACGANPLPLAIPCHRVLAKDGSLGGFSLGGLHVKEELLSIEGVKRAEEAAA